MAEPEKSQPETKTKEWTRDHKLALISIGIAVFFGFLGLIWNNNQTKIADKIVVNNQTTTNAPTTER
jgi:hypothetical protein